MAGNNMNILIIDAKVLIVIITVTTNVRLVITTLVAVKEESWTNITVITMTIDIVVNSLPVNIMMAETISIINVKVDSLSIDIKTRISSI